MCYTTVSRKIRNASRREVLHKANTPEFLHAVIKYISKESELPHIVAQDSNMTYVLDGGSIIHRIKWDKNMTYNKIVQK